MTIPEKYVADFEYLLGFRFSEEQQEAIFAPRQPLVIIAGAGSGKTEVMAARAAWLIASEQVRSDEILGLTFTRKATAELVQRTSERSKQLIQRQQRHPSSEVNAGENLIRAGEVAEPVVLTYNAFAQQLLHDYGLAIGFEPQWRLLDEGMSSQLAYEFVCRQPNHITQLGSTPSTIAKILLQADENLSNRCVSTQQLRTGESRRITALLRAQDSAAGGLRVRGLTMLENSEKRLYLADLIEQWRAEKWRHGVYDYADQLRLALKLLAKEQPGSDALVRRLREQFRAVFLDEYQDTSLAQHRLLRRIFGQGHSVTAVGDPFQAIYQWRGANPANIMNFSTEFPQYLPDGSRKPAQQRTLRTNRRSVPQILQMANDLAQDLRREHPQVPSLVPGRKEESPKATGVRVGIFPDDTSEAQWIAAQVQQQLQAGRDAQDIAVLASQWKLLEPVRAALNAKGIPTAFTGAAGLLYTAEVQYLLRMLRIIANQEDNVSTVALLSGPRWRIGDRDLSILAQRARGLNRRQRVSESTVESEGEVGGDTTQTEPALLDAVADPGDPKRFPYSFEARERFTRFYQELRELRDQQGMTLAELVRRIMWRSHLLAEIYTRPTMERTAGLAHVTEFRRYVTEFQGLDGRRDLAAFLHWIDMLDQSGKELKLPGTRLRAAVSLSTIHQAKGLEWPVVFLPAMKQGVLPKLQLTHWVGNVAELPPQYSDLPPQDSRLWYGSLEQIAQEPSRNKAGPTESDYKEMREVAVAEVQREQDRLMYVAATRARDVLLVTAPAVQTQGHTVHDRPLSCYLKPIWQQCLPQDRAVLAHKPTWEDVEQGVREIQEERRAEGEDLHQGHYPRQEQNLSTGDTQSALQERSIWRRYPRLIQAQERWKESARSVPEGQGLSQSERQLLARWEQQLSQMRQEKHESDVEPGMRRFSASELVSATQDRVAFDRLRRRPMPRRPNQAAQRGTEFHEWLVSRSAQQPILETVDLALWEDEDLIAEGELRQLQENFNRSEFAQRMPYRQEVPFALSREGLTVHGTIDAVFAQPDGSWLIVDWKTNRHATADPLQLAVYRLGWAEYMQVPLEQVQAVFYYVLLDRVVEPTQLLSEAEIVNLMRELHSASEGG